MICEILPRVMQAMYCFFTTRALFCGEDTSSLLRNSLREGITSIAMPSSIQMKLCSTPNGMETTSRTSGHSLSSGKE